MIGLFIVWKTTKLSAENQKTISRKTGPQTHLKANKCLFLFSLKQKKKKHVRLRKTRSENLSDLNLQATKIINETNNHFTKQSELIHTP